jgi:hypothetical protein
VPDDPGGVVLALHGGASRRGRMAAGPAQVSVLRMVPIARRAARAGGGRLAVFRLLNTIRGWDTHHTPLRDAEWALDEIASAWEDACLPASSATPSAAARPCSPRAPLFRSAVTLAPWVLPSDRPVYLAGRRILTVHGAAERVASLRRSGMLGEAIAVEADVSYVCVEDGRHAMLRRHSLFDGLAADFAAVTPPRGPLAQVFDAGSFSRL